MKQTAYANQVSIETAWSPLEILKELVADGQRTLRTWKQRTTSRRVLARLDQHELDDIGITEAERLAEAAKPFWEA